jgi:hypothetical protein
MEHFTMKSPTNPPHVLQMTLRFRIDSEIHFGMNLQKYSFHRMALDLHDPTGCGPNGFGHTDR